MHRQVHVAAQPQDPFELEEPPVGEMTDARNAITDVR
jgi:hypothetical protein